MLDVFVDLGMKEDRTDGVVSAASVVFKPTKYKQFVRPWNRMLKAWGASAFHATDFYNGAGEFERESEKSGKLFSVDSKRLPGMIADHIQRISVTSFRPKEFKEMVPKHWTDMFGQSVQAHSIQLCFLANGM